MTVEGKFIKKLKTYELEVPDRLKDRYKDRYMEIYEYILACHYDDYLMTAGACAFVLGISKFEFQTQTLYKYGIDYTQ